MMFVVYYYDDALLTMRRTALSLIPCSQHRQGGTRTTMDIVLTSQRRQPMWLSRRWRVPAMTCGSADVSAGCSVHSGITVTALGTKASMGRVGRCVDTQLRHPDTWLTWKQIPFSVFLGDLDSDPPSCSVKTSAGPAKDVKLTTRTHASLLLLASLTLVSWSAFYDFFFQHFHPKADVLYGSSGTTVGWQRDQRWPGQVSLCHVHTTSADR